MPLKEYIFPIILLLWSLLLKAQPIEKKTLDSLETALYLMDKADTVRILRAGNYIIKN